MNGRMQRRLLVVLALCMAAGCATNKRGTPALVEKGRAKASIAKAMDYIGGASTLAVEVFMTLDAEAGTEALHESARCRILLGQGERLRIGLLGDAPEAEAISDGKQLFLHRIEEKAFAVEALSIPRQEVLMRTMAPWQMAPAAEWCAAFMHNDGQILEQVRGAGIIGEEIVHQDGRDLLREQLYLKTEDFHLDLWLARGEAPLLQKMRMTVLPHRINCLGSFTPGERPPTMVLDFVFSNWRLNAPAPEESFSFAPGEGAEQADLGSRPLRFLLRVSQQKYPYKSG